jgi:hypothetical protein
MLASPVDGRNTANDATVIKDAKKPYLNAAGLMKRCKLILALLGTERLNNSVEEPTGQSQPQNRGPRKNATPTTITRKPISRKRPSKVEKRPEAIQSKGILKQILCKSGMAALPCIQNIPLIKNAVGPTKSKNPAKIAKYLHLCRFSEARNFI